ncbi:MAG: sulfurtransferase TusA family protein [Gammaproteobacteria bacterium]|nr:sulfurtransferase TusA family protein [Gammaproteobacteria bacterium]
MSRRPPSSDDPPAPSGADSPASVEVDQTLDVRSLMCPMPVLKAKVALADLAAGQVLRVLATDPHSVADFEAFCDKTGHELLSSRQNDDVFEFILRRHA